MLAFRLLSTTARLYAFNGGPTTSWSWASKTFRKSAGVAVASICESCLNMAYKALKKEAIDVGDSDEAQHLPKLIDEWTKILENTLTN